MERCEPRPSAQRIVEHARASGLQVERVEAFGRDGGGVGRAFGRLFGSFQPDYVERYLLVAMDGLRWIYVQPYSGVAVMPGEHHVPLWGSPEAPVVGDGSSWFDENRRFALRLAILCIATIVLSPIGIFLFVKLLPRAPTARGGPTAAAIDRLPAFTRLRYMGGVLSRDYLVPWTLQLLSVGGGQSRLVAVDPGTTKRGLGILHRGLPSFVEIGELARGVQAVMPRVDHPWQGPAKPLAWDDLVQPWLESAASSAPPSLPPPGPAPVAAAPRRSRMGAWAGMISGVGAALFGLMWVAVAISMLLHPVEPNSISSGWFCLISSTLLCVLPGGGGALYAALRIFREPPA
ncbi:MAG: hypothetical protein H6719_30250 [Sandaracinaceae bacterium]|nr:hypothetical protein [Sandaracinaceae bacterium]